MENLFITREFKKPEVSFDAQTGILKLTGNSIPENTDKFYDSIKEWLVKYLKNPRPESTINIKLFYLNSSSIRNMLMILEIIEEYVKNGGKFTVNWYYEEDDEDIMDTGKLYQKLVTIPINIISCPLEEKGG